MQKRVVIIIALIRTNCQHRQGGKSWQDLANKGSTRATTTMTSPEWANFSLVLMMIRMRVLALNEAFSRVLETAANYASTAVQCNGNNSIGMHHEQAENEN